jgi:sialate O-acetylesterase
MKYLSFTLSWAVALLMSLCADVKLSNIFTNHMVLQRDQKVPIWGTADAGEVITIEFNGQQVRLEASSDGDWMGELEPMAMSIAPLSMTIKGNNSLTLNDILIGDIYLCSGQSNMAYPLKKDLNADQEVPQSGNPQIRMLLTEWQTSDTPLTSVKRREGWRASSPEVASKCTAVGYYFAKEIQKSTGVPVGLLTAYKGGSPVEAWIPKEDLLSIETSREVWDKYEKALEVYPEKMKVYEKQIKKWRSDVKGLSIQERNKIKRPRMPYGPTDGNHPCGLFYGSIHPYIPFALKGILWYQGESNACSPMRYAKNYGILFSRMITSWRQAWQKEDLAFLFVQLAPYRVAAKEPEDSAWSRVQEGQSQALQLPHTGMAIITDVGNEKDIHPKNKWVPGQRLAQWAKSTIYGMDVPSSGPLMQDMEIQGDKVVITFRNSGAGLVAKDLTLVGGHQLSKDELKGFAICGQDKKMVWAEAKITGKNQVTVSSSKIKKPVAVRYAWSSFPLCNLFNTDGLPAGPFRTDDFE